MSDLKTNLQNILQEKQDKIIPENIKKDIQIFDVTGTYEGSGGTDTSDATATAEDIMSGKTAYVAEGKVTGTYVEVMSETDYQTCLQLADDIMGNSAPAKGHIYGIKRTIGINNSKWERTDDSLGLTATATHDGSSVLNNFDNLYPWKDIISYNYDINTNSETARYGDSDFTFEPVENNILVLTKIPTFWYKRIQEGNAEYIKIADYAADNFNKFDECSVARYVVSGTSEEPIVKSKSTPLRSISIVDSRTLATTLGSEFKLLDWQTLGAIQLLYLVEYADYNSQFTLGQGISSSTVTASGGCDELGMKSGCFVSDGKHSVIYRGIENVFGNLYQWLDGINFQGNRGYVCNNPYAYESNVFDGEYVALSYACATRGTYGFKVGCDNNNSLAMFATETGGSSTTGLTDLMKLEPSGNRVVSIGGFYSDEDYNGLFNTNDYYTANASPGDRGVRIVRVHN